MANGAIFAGLGGLHRDGRRVVAVFRVFGPADFDGGNVKDRQIARGLRMAHGSSDEFRGLITYEHEWFSDLRKLRLRLHDLCDRALVEPVGSVFHIDLEGRVQGVGAFHGFFDDGCDALQFFLGVSSTSSSCTWRVIRARNPSSFSRRCSAIIAILMMSAAVPWIGWLIAARSAAWRSCTPEPTRQWSSSTGK